MEPGALAKVLNDFFTTVDGELSLPKGDYFLVHRILDKHWCYGESQGRSGKFPSNYLYKIELPDFRESESLFISVAAFPGEQEGDLSFGKGELIIGICEAESAGWYIGRTADSRQGPFPTSHTWQLDPAIVKKNSEKKVLSRKARVTTSLTAQFADELHLNVGEIVTVQEILEDGWCRGVKEDGTEGNFPQGFISYINEESDPTAIGAGERRGNSPDPVPDTPDFLHEYGLPLPDPAEQNQATGSGTDPCAVTLYAFDAQFPNELSFQPGEIVSLVRYVDSEWLEGRKGNTTGIFPVSYVNIIRDCPSENVDQQIPLNIDKNGPRNDPWSEKDEKKDDEADMLAFTAKLDLDPCGDKQRTSTVATASEPSNQIRSMEEIPSEGSRRHSEPHREAPAVPDTAATVPTFPEDCAHESTKVKGKAAKPSTNVHQEKATPSDSTIQIDDKAIERDAEQRQNVISELVLTEREYIRDLKLTYEVFHLYDPSFLESRGIDTGILFGNLFDIILISEQLLDLIMKAMKGRSEEAQRIGPCFLKMAPELQTVYVKYCGNHEAALSLLQNYENNEEAASFFGKAIETLRYQIACFDMSSILIKPVQRILKYPLILRELLKYTLPDHVDRGSVEEACTTMTRVASYINESKRRKDLVSKYLENHENTLRKKIANLSMHSVAKISTRLSTKLSASFGLTNIVADPEFEELERQFRSVEKCTWQLVKDAEQCLAFLNSEALSAEVISESLFQYYQGLQNGEVVNLRNIRSAVRSIFLQDLKSCLEMRVHVPTTSLGQLLEGPAVLITKRHDKLLDYDAAISKSEKYKDSKIVHEELITAKCNFEALSQQLLEELPVLIDAATKLLSECISALAHARKFLCGRIAKRYLSLCEATPQLSSQDILESFLINHHLLSNQLTRFSLRRTGTVAEDEHEEERCREQSESERALLRAKYPIEKLYTVLETASSSSPIDLAAIKGTLVAVMKQQDPMGNTAKWFVDNGMAKGFIPAAALSPIRKPQAEDQQQPQQLSRHSPASGDGSTSETRLEEMLSLNFDSQQASLVNDDQFYYAQFDFHANLSGTLAISKGQVVKLLRDHDEKGNGEWWLVQDRNHHKGYVPRNYLSQLRI